MTYRDQNWHAITTWHSLHTQSLLTYMALLSVHCSFNMFSSWVVLVVVVGFCRGVPNTSSAKNRPVPVALTPKRRSNSITALTMQATASVMFFAPVMTTSSTWTVYLALVGSSHAVSADSTFTTALKNFGVCKKRKPIRHYSLLTFQYEIKAQWTCQLTSLITSHLFFMWSVVKAGKLASE